MKHIYIKRTHEELTEDRAKLEHLFDDESFYGEVPNSIPKFPYKPHPQFTITLTGVKITFWADENEEGVQ